MRRILLAGMAVAAISGFAQAADLSYPAPSTGAGPMMAPTATFNWAGTYIGINGGFGSGRLDWAYVPGGGTANQSTSGGLLGVTLGVNALNGPWLYGVEGDVDWANINGSTPCPNPTFSCHSNLTGWVPSGDGWDGQ